MRTTVGSIVEATVIVPVKRLAIGKSRLRVSSGGVPVDDVLVLAIVLDTVAAVLATGARVLVVTRDALVAAEAGLLGAATVDDEPDNGLNPAIRHGEMVAGLLVGRVTLTSDLPALRPADLTGALTAAAGRRAYVADHPGTGTTMLVAPPGVPLNPLFGGASAAAHAASGAFALDGAWPSLRLDVDTPADLDLARTLGLGPRTRAAGVE